MISITIEGDKIESERDFHNLVSSAMNFPNYYGKNMDAFWECYTEFLISYPDEKISIDWLNHADSKNKLGEKFFNLIVTLLEDGKKEWKPDLKIKLC